MDKKQLGIFRRDAIEQHSSGARAGSVLRLSPAWVRWSYPLLLFFGAVGITYLTTGQVQEYARGPAIVQFTGYTNVTSPVAATIESVVAVVGHRITKGETVVVLESGQERAELARLERELKVRQAQFLRKPDDTVGRQALARLRTREELARKQLEARVLRAAHDGIVADLRVQPGQPILPGQIAATIRHDESDLKVIGLIPGQYRPQLQPKLRARLEIPGFSHAFQDIKLVSIADGVIGPSEARRFLGQDVGDAVTVSGSVVLVEASLASDVFLADGGAYSYHHGMYATLEIQLRSEPIILALVPGLNCFIEDHHD